MKYSFHEAAEREFLLAIEYYEECQPSFHKKWRLNRGDIMRESIAESIMSTVRDLEKIVCIRKKFKLSQAALASVFNISPSTVKKWEQGVKKPAGASRKLLDIMERKGLEALM